MNVPASGSIFGHLIRNFFRWFFPQSPNARLIINRVTWQFSHPLLRLNGVSYDVNVGFRRALLNCNQI